MYTSTTALVNQTQDSKAEIIDGIDEIFYMTIKLIVTSSDPVSDKFYIRLNKCLWKCFFDLFTITPEKVEQYFLHREDHCFWQMLDALFKYPELASKVLALTDGEYCCTLLHTMIANEHIDDIVMILNRAQKCNVTIDYTSQDIEGKSLLFIAINILSLEVVTAMLNDMRARKTHRDNKDLKYLVNFPDKAGRTPLYLAAALGQREIMALLISCGAEVKDTQLLNLTRLPDQKYEQQLKEYLNKISIHPDRDAHFRRSHFGFTEMTCTPFPEKELIGSKLLFVPLAPYASTKLPTGYCLLLSCSKNLLTLVAIKVECFVSVLRSLINSEEPENAKKQGREFIRQYDTVIFKSAIYSKKATDNYITEQQRQQIIAWTESVYKFLVDLKPSATSYLSTKKQEIISLMKQLAEAANKSILQVCLQSREQIVQDLLPYVKAVSEQKVEEVKTVPITSPQSKEYLLRLDFVLGQAAGKKLVRIDEKIATVSFPSFWLRQLGSKAMEELSRELAVDIKMLTPR